MTVNCRFLKPLDFASHSTKPINKGCFTLMAFSGYVTLPETCLHRLPLSLAFVARSHLFGRIFWAFVNFL
jgi:hypothetical protein